MSNTSDSQNLPSGEEPYAGEPSDLASYESRMDLDQFLILPALGVEYPFERPDEISESPAPSVEGLVHREGRSQPMDEAGPSERASMSGTGNRPALIDEDEEEEKGNGGGENEKRSDDGEDAGEEGEEEETESVKVVGPVTVAVANPDTATSEKPRRRRRKQRRFRLSSAQST